MIGDETIPRSALGDSQYNFTQQSGVITGPYSLNGLFD